MEKEHFDFNLFKKHNWGLEKTTERLFCFNFFPNLPSLEASGLPNVQVAELKGRIQPIKTLDMDFHNS